MQLEIVIRHRQREERTSLSTEDGLVTFGRHPASSVRLDDDSVSRDHARVRVTGGVMRVEDCSTNGTLAAGRILKRTAAEVPIGAPLQMGDYTIMIAAGPGQPVQSEKPGAADIALRREAHRLLLANLDLVTLDASKADDPSLRFKVLTALRKVISMLEARLPPDVDRDALVGELADEALGLGPLERFLADPSISEIMVVDPDTIFVERSGRLVLADARFTDDERVRAVVERIVTPLGRRIDESSPLVDARLRDGSRVNAVIRPLAIRGTCITIRKFSKSPLTLDRLVELGALTPAMG